MKSLGCVTFDHDLILHWNAAMEATHGNDEAYVATFTFTLGNQKKRLRFVASSAHNGDPEAPTNKLIHGQLTEDPPQVLILEFENEPLEEETQRAMAGEENQHCEPGYAVHVIASQTLATRFIAGEQSWPKLCKTIVESSEYTYRDLIYYYTACRLARSLQNGEIDQEQASTFLETNFASFHDELKILEEGSLNLEDMSINDFLEWYKASTANSSITLENLASDIQDFDLGPSDDPDALRINRIPHQAAILRDPHILDLIERQLNYPSVHNVMVIYGGSHYPVQEMVLRQQLGDPTITPYVA